ncbi:ankyrin, partial [Canariomyces notabilis]
CVKALVEHGADSNVRTSRGATALQLSFEMGDQTDEITKLLLSRGADPNAEVGFGRTMLHLAAAMGLARIVPELVAAGGDVARRDYYGQTPWATAVRYGHTDVAEALAAAGGR